MIVWSAECEGSEFIRMPIKNCGSGCKYRYNFWDVVPPAVLFYINMWYSRGVMLKFLLAIFLSGLTVTAQTVDYQFEPLKVTALRLSDHYLDLSKSITVIDSQAIDLIEITGS